MSQVSQQKLKALFDGLRRPTNRGIRKCPKCRTINGTRGNFCKNRSCDVVFRATGPEGASKKNSTDACKIETSFSGTQIFSVRQRDRGPDYRSFVQLPVKESSNETDFESPDNSKCYKASCNKSKEPCGHIQAAQRCFSAAENLPVKQSAASTLNIPPDHQQLLQIYLNETSDPLVQRVSKTSFVVKCDMSKKHPLGFLHIMFLRNKTEEKIEKRFLCSCKPFKGKEGDITNSNDSGESSAKFCMHYHACLWAFASDPNLSSEFNYFLTQAGHCAPTLLSQLHLVTLPQTMGTSSLDGIDTNHISVEIMQDNISLLESIAAVDDVTLHNVQGLEGVLSDQIIVANVDDSLTFGDTSALEGLEDGDSQVCQIFSGASNTIQLTNPFTIGEPMHQTVNLASSAVLTSTTLPIPHTSKHFNHQQHSSDERDASTNIAGTSPQILSMISSSSNTYENGEKESQAKQSEHKSLPSTTVAFNTPLSTVLHNPQQPESGQSQISTDAQKDNLDEFEIWLAGVNERINAVMNYQFNGKPEPIVYYISLKFFDRIKERIISGVKKKRLPNQTVIITRTDRPPAGTFTKHVWKITNLLHVLHIFHSQIIPLKINQYFIKGTNGVYEEWLPPKETDRVNQPIKPYVHSTFLKVGRNEATPTESKPFVIEWIPDILPESRLGELSIIFEFGHHSPSSREESLNTQV